MQIPIDSYDIATIGDAWVVAIDYDQWTTPTLIDTATGTIVDARKQGAHEGARSAARDGKTLFIGDSNSTGSALRRYDVSSGKLVPTATWSPANGFPAPARAVQSAADGSFVFYDGHALEGTALKTVDYVQSDTIRSVTPDNRLAISGSQVNRASDGVALGALPVTPPRRPSAPTAGRSTSSAAARCAR